MTNRGLTYATVCQALAKQYAGDYNITTAYAYENYFNAYIRDSNEGWMVSVFHYQVLVAEYTFSQYPLARKCCEKGEFIIKQGGKVRHVWCRRVAC